jgi:hypothetical protein
MLNQKKPIKSPALSAKALTQNEFPAIKLLKRYFPGSIINITFVTGVSGRSTQAN